MNTRLSIVALLITLASGACMAQSSSPSLADVARETREEKKTAKVFTDEDLPSRRSSDTNSTKLAGSSAGSTDSSTSADAKPASDPAQNGKADKAPASPGKGEGAIAELKKKRDHYVEERDSWKKSVQRYEDLLQDETSEFRRQTYEAALDVDRHNVELYQQKIDELQGQIEKSQQERQSSAKEPDSQPAAPGHP